MKKSLSMDKENNKYDDIINLSHKTSDVHPRMPYADRAAQFSPFAALTGHDDAIKETARITDKKAELDEDKKALINEKLMMIDAAINGQSYYGNEVKCSDTDCICESECKKISNKCSVVSVTYFVPDLCKSGGEYVCVLGDVVKIDKYRNLLFMEDGVIIPIKEIMDVEIITERESF